MNDLEAIIFDLDGVLADTVEYHYRAWQQIAVLLDVPFTRMDMDHFRGRQRRDCLLLLLGDRRLDSATFERYMLLKDEFYMADAAAMTAASLLPGVLPFILEAHEFGLKMGVASSSQSARFILQQTGILAYMDVVGDGGTVARSKPAPDIFLWVAGALRTAPKHIVVFEDSRAGIEAARTAGMFVVGVGEGINADQAHVRIPSLEHIHLSDLTEKHRQAGRQP